MSQGCDGQVLYILRSHVTQMKNVTRDDIFRLKADFKKLYEDLSNNKIFEETEDNFLVKLFIDAKINGYFYDLMYDVSKPEFTCLKNIMVMRKLSYEFKKPFSKLTIEDIRELQRKINAKELICKQPSNKINAKKEIRPLSRAYLQDLIITIKQFWTFYIMYCKMEKKIEIEDITKYLRQKKENKNNSLIKFITKEEIDILVKNSATQKMKTFIIVFFELGARITEILSLKMNNCKFDEAKQKWTVRLPNVKGNSTTKMPIEIEISSKYLDEWIKMNDFESEDYLFDYSYNYVKEFLRRKGKKCLGRTICPKQFRKGCTMWLISLNANEQYIRSHMGWAAGSHAINHYINQTAIHKPANLNNTIQKEYFSDIMTENENLRIQQKIQTDRIKEMMTQMEEMKKEQLKLFMAMKDVDVSASKNLLKVVFEEILKKGVSNAEYIPEAKQITDNSQY